MIKKLTKHGNSLALVIERPILELLKIDADTDLEITTNGHSMIISPVSNPARRQRFANALSETNKEYGSMLKRLAE